MLSSSCSSSFSFFSPPPSSTFLVFSSSFYFIYTCFFQYLSFSVALSSSSTIFFLFFFFSLVYPSSSTETGLSSQHLPFPSLPPLPSLLLISHTHSFFPSFPAILYFYHTVLPRLSSLFHPLVPYPTSIRFIYFHFLFPVMASLYTSFLPWSFFTTFIVHFTTFSPFKILSILSLSFPLSFPSLSLRFYSFPIHLCFPWRPFMSPITSTPSYEAVSAGRWVVSVVRTEQHLWWVGA